MKVLISGSTGFLGSHLVEYHLKHGDEVVGFDNLSRGAYSARNLLDVPHNLIIGDILDFPKLQKVMTGVDLVYHMAALPSHRLALERPHEYMMIDLQGTANVLETARLCNPKPLVVFASTNKVYGKQECPWREDKLPQPEGPYAVAKWASEKMCEMYNKYYDIPCIILRYHHAAGKRSNPELALSVFVEQALKNEPIEVHGSFENGFTSSSADYTHVDDAIEATVKIADNYTGFDIVNIANKKLTLVEDIAKRVIRNLNPTLEIKHVPLWKHETLMHHSDVSKAEEKYGFVACIPVEQAIDEYIEWRVKR